jgi:hypothetical protein
LSKNQQKRDRKRQRKAAQNPKPESPPAPAPTKAASKNSNGNGSPAPAGTNGKSDGKSRKPATKSAAKGPGSTPAAAARRSKTVWLDDDPKLTKPTLRFTPKAWAKMRVLCKWARTEIMGYGITSLKDPLLLEDIGLIRQTASYAHWDITGADIAEYMERMMLERPELPVENFFRVWIHTHPGGMSPNPSGTDETTFSDRHGCGEWDWAVMFIMAETTGETYARLRHGQGPLKTEVELKVDTIFDQTFEGVTEDDVEAWKLEFDAYVIENFHTAGYHGGYGGYAGHTMYGGPGVSLGASEEDGIWPSLGGTPVLPQASFVGRRAQMDDILQQTEGVSPTEVNDADIGKYEDMVNSALDNIETLSPDDMATLLHEADEIGLQTEADDARSRLRHMGMMPPLGLPTSASAHDVALEMETSEAQIAMYERQLEEQLPADEKPNDGQYPEGAQNTLSLGSFPVDEDEETKVDMEPVSAPSTDTTLPEDM